MTTTVRSEVRVADAIRASKLLLQCVIDSTPDWIHVKDREHRFILVNRSFAQAFGRTPEAMIGSVDADLLPRPLGDDSARQTASMRRRDVAVFGGETIHDEHDEIVTSDGTRRIFDTFKGPLRDPSNAIYGVLTFSRDVTERLRNEQEQRALEEQLRQAQKMEVIGHLTGGIAHDFNNILTAIFGFAELAQLSPQVRQDASLSRYLQRIVEAAARARDLVSQLLTFSHRREAADESSGVAPIVKEVKKLLRSTTPASIAIRLSLEEDLPDVLISSIQLHQILMNLAVNAADAIGSKGTIEIEAASVALDRPIVCASCQGHIEGRYVMIAVGDSGCGISPENLPRIFDPFFSTKEVSRGTGLGLSVLHGIVHSANGHVSVSTRVGDGTRFNVYLPPRPKAARQVRTRAGPKVRHDRVTGRVLLVDDEPDILEFMSALLEQMGCTVLGTPSSIEAWRLFQQAPEDVDLVIADQTMPDMTGAELARAILARRPELPIVLSTGYSAAIDEQIAADIGICRLLRKPVPSRVLRDLVAQLLPRQEGAR